MKGGGGNRAKSEANRAKNTNPTVLVCDGISSTLSTMKAKKQESKKSKKG